MAQFASNQLKEYFTPIRLGLKNHPDKNVYCPQAEPLVNKLKEFNAQETKLFIFPLFLKKNRSI